MMSRRSVASCRVQIHFKTVLHSCRLASLQNQRSCSMHGKLVLQSCHHTCVRALYETASLHCQMHHWVAVGTCLTGRCCSLAMRHVRSVPSCCFLGLDMPG